MELEQGVHVQGRLLEATTGKPFADSMVAHIKSTQTAFETHLPIDPQPQTGCWETWLAPGPYTVEFYLPAWTGSRMMKEPPFEFTVKPGEACDAGFFKISLDAAGAP